MGWLPSTKTRSRGITAPPGMLKPVGHELRRQAADFWGQGAIYTDSADFIHGALPTNGVPTPVRPVTQTVDTSRISLGGWSPGDNADHP